MILQQEILSYKRVSLLAARKESLAKFLILDLYAKERTISDAMPNRHFIANIADVLPIRNFI